jgi:transposase
VDGHHDAIAVAYGHEAREAAVVFWGRIGTRQGDSDQRIRTRTSNARPRVCGDEAGPCGSWRDRDLTTKQLLCGVVAPALVPKPAGDRVNTARREAIPRARLMRSGALTPVDVPAVEDEAIRDLSRAREETSRDLKTAQSRVQAFRRRPDRRDEGRATWGPAPRRWLAAVVWATPAPPMVFQASVRAVAAPQARLQRLATARREPVQGWRLAPGVQALQAMPGVQVTVAVTRIAARGDLRRVEHPRPRMSSLGLTPSADARGARRRHGSSTTAGHTCARRARMAEAWSDRYPAQVRRPLPWRWAQLPQAIQNLGWKAPVRRCQRCRYRTARGQHATQVVVAMARDMAACIGAIARAGHMTREAPRPRRAPSAARRDASTIGRAAASVWRHPRRREAAARHPPASSEAGARRTPVRWDPTHRYQPAQPA